MRKRTIVNEKTGSIQVYDVEDKSTINTNDFAGSLDNLITKKKFFIVDDEDEDNELKKY